MITLIQLKEIKFPINSGSVSHRTIGMSIKQALAALLCFGFLALRVHASPIVYTFTGIGNGNVIGGTSFNNAAFNMSFLADTQDPYSHLSGFVANFAVLSSSSAFSLTGIGSGGFSSPMYVYDVPGPGDLGIYSENVLNVVPDVLELKSAGFTAYRLRDAFGPVESTDQTSAAFVMHTTLGTIDLTPVGNISFSAMLVPEGNSHGLLLFGSVLLGLGILKKGVERRG